MEAMTIEPKQGHSIEQQRYAIEKTRKTGKNSLRVADIKTDILDSGATSIYVKMGLTGKSITIDENGEEQIGDDLEQTERMKCLKTICDYVIPKAEKMEVSEDTQAKWAGLADKLIAGVSETEKTP